MKLKTYVVKLDRFNKFEQQKETQKIDLGESLLLNANLIKTLNMNAQEKLIFYYLACLASLNDREDNFNELVDELLEKCTNKLLIANIFMLDLRIRIDKN